MPPPKKKPKAAKLTLVIGSPTDFKRGTEAAELMRQVGMPTLRGGADVESWRIPPLEFSDDDMSSVISLKAFANEYRLRSVAAPPIAEGRAAACTTALPDPLKSNPPGTVGLPPLLPAIELEGDSTLQPSNGKSRGRRSNSEALALNRHSVVYGGFGVGTSLPPIMENMAEVPLLDSEPSHSSGRIIPNVRSNSQRTTRPARTVTKSRLPAIAPLPFEMREPLKIWQKYTKSNVIDVYVCDAALDSEGAYTWTHCWGLFNLYTFGASFMNDTEFADRVMDMLCRNLEPGKAADVDTICLVFEPENIPSRLKQLVVDRCIDGEAKYLSRSVTKGLPHEFAAAALETAMERHADSGWRQRLASPCRYHRHKRAEDCYLRKCFDEGNEPIIEQRKRSRTTNAQVRFELDTTESRDRLLKSTDNGLLPARVDSLPVQEHHDTVANKATDSDGISANAIEMSMARIQETDLATDESSVIAALGLEDSEVSTAKLCEILKPPGAVCVVDVAKPRSDPRSSLRCSTIACEGKDGRSLLGDRSTFSERMRSEEILMPGA